MKFRKIRRFLLLLMGFVSIGSLLNIAFSQPPAPTLTFKMNITCVVSDEDLTSHGYYPFLKMSDYNNADVEVRSLTNYPYTLYCKAEYKGVQLRFDVIDSTSSCDTGYKCLMHLNSTTNAHAQLCNESGYTNFLCIAPSSPNPFLQVSDFNIAFVRASQSCTSLNMSCVVVLSDATNAHLFNCSYMLLPPTGWKICMGITTTTVSITSFRKFIPEVIIPSSVTAYEGRESRFAIITKNRGSLEGILHIELKPLDVELFENIYFTSKKYFRNDRAKLDVFLKPGETKYVVVSVIPPFNKTYTVNVTWNAHAFSDSKQLIIDVKKLSSREKKEDLPGMEFPQFVLIILFSTIILMGSLIE